MNCDQNVIMVIENITHMGTHFCYLFPTRINYLLLTRNEWQILKWEFKYKEVMWNMKLVKSKTMFHFKMFKRK